ncbi:helix-turn-helix domain-containing protein [Thioalbus denitrificans]|uniref:CRP/FNR family transcriptional regulator n=1 Tax=Thioalbus denitrificans TaxID=547122 RepID=A0A369BTC4_9GAMM|nr:helix-turn-helix domain-containing protein [Thioalbus denitrificans]RCX24813.1 CRP/FNR family transcriptional regulator [Thioalbus denitrificans]
MAKSSANIRLVHVKRACEECAVRRLCLPTSLAESDLESLSSLVQRRGPFQKGDLIYRAGEDFNSLFALQSGSVKTYGLTHDGEEQITGFHLVGELLGMDAIGNEVHPCNAIALETTWVCEMPYAKLSELAELVPGLQREMFRVLGKEIRQDEHALMLVRRLRAEQRVMRFLNSLYQRMRERYGLIEEIPLPMSREDIANYLGLAPETLSRALTKLRNDGVIDVTTRSVRFLDMVAVCRLAC